MTAAKQAIVQVDAFTSEPYRGNPAAVCVLAAARDDDWLQAVAREMNLSETAFLWRRADGFDLRWFTPTTEIGFCGHATLASAHALWEQGELAPDAEARFHTHAGVLGARRHGAWIALDFPSFPPSAGGVPDEVAQVLGVEPVATAVSAGAHLVEVASAAVLRAVAPDFRRLARCSPQATMVTAAGDGEYDFVSRVFVPAKGIDEDPVTGSAHCVLGPYWAAKLGKSELAAYQASARGGVLRLRVAGPGVVPGRIEVRGQAVTVLRGELV